MVRVWGQTVWSARGGALAKREGAMIQWTKLSIIEAEDNAARHLHLASPAVAACTPTIRCTCATSELT